MCVCLLSCQFLLQSDQSTDCCRGTAGNLNDKKQTFTHAVFRSSVGRARGSQLVLSNDFEKLEFLLECCGRYYNNHASAVTFGSMFGSLFLAFLYD